MSSESFYDWEKSLQSNSLSQFVISPSPLRSNKKTKVKSKGTIDYFINTNTDKVIPKSFNTPIEDLNDIGELIFQKIVKLWKLKNLE